MRWPMSARGAPSTGQRVNHSLIDAFSPVVSDCPFIGDDCRLPECHTREKGVFDDYLTALCPAPEHVPKSSAAAAPETIWAFIFRVVIRDEFQIVKPSPLVFVLYTPYTYDSTISLDHCKSGFRAGVLCPFSRRAHKRPYAASNQPRIFHNSRAALREIVESLSGWNVLRNNGTGQNQEPEIRPVGSLLPSADCLFLQVIHWNFRR